MTTTTTTTTTTEGTMTAPDIQRATSVLEAAGLRPLLCDARLTHYHNSVHAGTPTMTGDEISDDYRVPRAVLSAHPEMVVDVRGDSMTDAGIGDGDRVRIELGARVMDGDIVVAQVDGEVTVKAYYEDDEGRPWLVPYNTRYEAINLATKSNVWLIGRVTEVMKPQPRMSHRESQAAVRRTLQHTPGTTLARERAQHAIRAVAPGVKTGRQWFAVLRALADNQVWPATDYQGFCAEVRSLCEGHGALPSVPELRRMAVQSFTKPWREWKAFDAPVSGQRFVEYSQLAEATDALVAPKV